MKDSDYPHITVAAIVEKGGKFLLIEEHSEGRIVFNQPAGHLELGESLLDAVKRETLEESGYHFTPKAISGIYLLEAANGITYLRICFSGNVGDYDESVELDEEIITPCWLSRDEIEAKGEMIRSAMVLKGIDDYLSGQSYSLEMLHHLASELSH